MNRLKEIKVSLSKIIQVTTILVLICCLCIVANCRKQPASADTQKQKDRSRNVDFHEKDASRQVPTLPGAEDQIKVDTLTLEFLRSMADCWASHLNEPNDDADTGIQEGKGTRENRDPNEKSKTEREL